MNKATKKTILKIVVSVALFGFIFYNIDTASLVENFRKLNVAYIPLIAGLLIANYLISSLRWKLLLIHKGGEAVSLKYLSYLYFEGSFFNNFMPTSIGGDVFKVVKLSKKLNDRTVAFVSTFMERFTGVIALVLISYVGLVQSLDFWLSQLPQQLIANQSVKIFIEVMIFAGFWIGAIFAFFALKILSKKVGAVKKVYDALMAYKGENRVLFYAFISSLLVQFLAILTQYFVFKALGVDLPILYSLVVFPVVTLASFFIPSLNGLGVQDALFIQFLAVISISSEVALSGSIIYHLFRLFVSLIGGIIYLLGKTEIIEADVSAVPADTV